MRSKVAAALGALALTVGAASAAKASLVAIGPVTTGTYVGSTSGLTTGSYTDFFSFSSVSAFQLNVLIATTVITPNPYVNSNITPATYALYSGIANDGTPDTLVVNFTPSASSPAVLASAVINKGIFSAGDYYIELQGNVSAAGSLGNTATISVSAVPIPATFSMFGAGILALGAFGFLMKRKAINQGTLPPVLA